MLEAMLRTLAEEPNADLDPAEVALHLAADEYPGLDVDSYLVELDELAERAQPYLIGDIVRQAEGLAAFLFQIEGFHGNRDDYYAPQNSYFNDVLDRRTGIPITLSVLAMSVGRRAGLEVHGVGLPGHFIAKICDRDDSILIDPFHRGRLLGPDDCRDLVESVTGRPFAVTAETLSAVPVAPIVMRMLNNLRSIYASREDFPRMIRILERQRQLDPDDPTLRRDLGITLSRNGQYGPSLDHLRAYLSESPDAGDAADVKQLLERTRAEIARWN
jgi:regulator of sirC expression with transglutaminase-like and TPR domain